MRGIIVITRALIFFAIASVSAAAQTPPRTPAATAPKPAVNQPTPNANAPVPDTKIAIIDTSLFGDEKAGITRYLNAAKSVQREFQPRQAELTNLQIRIKAISDEITKLSGTTVVDPKSIQTKRDEGDRLQRDLKYKKEQADADFEKRYNEVVGPISNDIGKALDQYATQHGLTMVLDISKLLPAVLTVNPATDITPAFIAEYNSKNP
jgi:Skp family chaperone for outer membrane proteins